MSISQLDAQLLKIGLYCHQCAVIQHPATGVPVLPRSVQRCKRSPSDGLRSRPSTDGPVHNSGREIGLPGPLKYAACFTWGGDRWQRPRNSHRVRRQLRRGSGGRRDARQRQHASEGRPQPRPQPHGRRTRLRPAVLGLVYAGHARDLDLILTRLPTS
jgi:hypothetical protein